LNFLTWTEEFWVLRGKRQKKKDGGVEEGREEYEEFYTE
jgi:hypothetical protein